MRNIKNGRPFQFRLESKSENKAPTVTAISLSGTNALTAIADKDEFLGLSLPDIFDGIWRNELIHGNQTSVRGSYAVLKRFFPELFIHVNSKNVRDNELISVYDTANLLRKSLNNCTIYLRASKNTLDREKFMYWSEVYYHSSILLFGENEGLTPYKLKMLLIPQILDAGFCKPPWHHMCEAQEKSNHHANKDFQTRTMRGGGLRHHQDPMFLEGFHSFCRILHVASSTSNVPASKLLDNANHIYLEDGQLTSKTYLDICQKPFQIPVLQMDPNRSQDSLLSGYRFYILGNIPKNIGTKPIIESKICEMGGMILSKEQAKLLAKNSSRTPFCYVLLPNDKELKLGTAERTGTITETESEREGETSLPKAPNPNATRQPRLKGTALACREFAATDFKFININFILDTENGGKMIDPEPYILKPLTSFKKNYVNDTRPLLANQCATHPEYEIKRSVVSVLKESRKLKRLEETENDQEMNELKK